MKRRTPSLSLAGVNMGPSSISLLAMLLTPSSVVITSFGASLTFLYCSLTSAISSSSAFRTWSFGDQVEAHHVVPEGLAGLVQLELEGGSLLRLPLVLPVVGTGLRVLGKGSFEQELEHGVGEAEGKGIGLLLQ